MPRRWRGRLAAAIVVAWALACVVVFVGHWLDGLSHRRNAAVVGEQAKFRETASVESLRRRVASADPVEATAVSPAEPLGRPAADPRTADPAGRGRPGRTDPRSPRPGLAPAVSVEPTVQPDPSAAAPGHLIFSLLGVSDQGGRVAFLLDNSADMAARSAGVRASLAQAILRLGPAARFQVILFSDGWPTVMPIRGSVHLEPAMDRNKAAAAEWLDGCKPDAAAGPLDPQPALERAFKLVNGPPDVIFLVVGGAVPAETVQTLGRLDPDHQVRIHVLVYGQPSADAKFVFRRITEGNARSSVSYF